MEKIHTGNDRVTREFLELISALFRNAEESRHVQEEGSECGILLSSAVHSLEGHDTEIKLSLCAKHQATKT
jgi:hypothetical protein